MIKDAKEFNEVLMAKQIFLIIGSAKKDGWKDDQPCIGVHPYSGIDSICGKEFIDEANKELVPILKSQNRKYLKRVKDAEKECIETLKTVDGLFEELIKDYPYMDPDYVAPVVEKGPIQKD